MNKEELIEELRLSLKSKIMLELVKNGAVKICGDYIFLKRRDGTDFCNPIKWEENKGFQYDYKEIHDKNVVFSFSLFGDRGQKAVMKYIETV